MPEPIDLTDREADMLCAVKTAHDNGLDGFITGRLFRRSTAEKLADVGLLDRLRLVVTGDAGFPLEPERWRDGYSLTDDGRAAIDRYVFEWERDQ